MSSNRIPPGSTNSPNCGTMIFAQNSPNSAPLAMETTLRGFLGKGEIFKKGGCKSVRLRFYRLLHRCFLFIWGFGGRAYFLSSCLVYSFIARKKNCLGVQGGFNILNSIRKSEPHHQRDHVKFIQRLVMCKREEYPQGTNSTVGRSDIFY